MTEQVSASVSLLPEKLTTRRRLPDTRMAVTHKFDIAGHEGYVTVGFFDDNKIGEVFIQMAKEGSTIGGLMDTIGILTSVALQHGVSLDSLVKKFEHQRFEPSGWTKNKDIHQASSVVDYIFRWMKTVKPPEPVALPCSS